MNKCSRPSHLQLSVAFTVPEGPFQKFVRRGALGAIYEYLLSVIFIKLD